LVQVVGAPAQEEEAGRTGIDVQARHPQGVVVEPQGAGCLVVAVVGTGRAGRPRAAVPVLVRRGHPLVRRPDPGVLGRDGVGVREEPALRVAVALLVGVTTMQVHDDRHRPPVRAGRVRELVVPVAPLLATAGVRPVQRRVHRQEVGQVAS
jgi:hypothetical protein